ncbi:MAG: DUF3445 domain-containing protein [Roseovarius sp.]
MSEILQRATPHDLGAQRPLPGVAPLDPAAWLHVDEAFGAQMAERARLLREARAEVVAMTEGARPACDELLQTVLAWLAAHAPGYAVGEAEVRRPDGVRIGIDRDDPLGTLGLLVQEDLCVMERRPGAAEHVLSAAVLCFPASWRLADKIGRPLSEIHAPVPEYDGDLARRVQRLFDGVREGRPLWRFNLLAYDSATLFQPVSRRDPRSPATAPGAPYLRSERQCVLRLPRTRACVFSIHTYVLRRGTAAGAGDAQID